MDHREKCEAQVDIYFRLQPAARKFDSPANRKLVADRLASWGFVPSEVATMRALDELISEGAVSRTDGGSEASDHQAAADAERRRVDALASAPLTEADFHKFARMSEAQVEHLFWTDPVFKARYKRASQLWQFRLPMGPPPAETPMTEENENSQWKSLTAKEWHSIPARRASQLLLSDAGFKRAVNRLVEAGKI